jgi:hypothetical protein
MKILVIPDVHNKVDMVDRILDHEKDFDKVIFLGDLFDHFNDGPTEATLVANWIKSHINDERFIFLFGNHDIGYAFKNFHLPCSGYSVLKDIAIWKILNADDFAKWKFFWVAQGFLFTHAGLHPNYLPPLWKSKDVCAKSIKEFLLEESEKCLIQVHQKDGEHWFYRYGDARCYPPRGVKAGGILWCDASEEFEAIPNLSQIFGHTPCRTTPMIVGNGTGMGKIAISDLSTASYGCFNHMNFDLDCHLKYYGVVENNCFVIKRTP